MNAEMTLDELRRLSEAATPGEWRYPVGGAIDARLPDGFFRGVVTGEVRNEDARFIVGLVNWFRSTIESQDREAGAPATDAVDLGLPDASGSGEVATPLGPAPNVPGCTCDRDDDSWVGEDVPMPLCPLHEKRFRHLSWESLACMVIDYEAALTRSAARLQEQPR